MIGTVLMPAKLFVDAAKVGVSAFTVGLKGAVTSVLESRDPEKAKKIGKEDR